MLIIYAIIMVKKENVPTTHLIGTNKINYIYRYAHFKQSLIIQSIRFAYKNYIPK